MKRPKMLLTAILVIVAILLPATVAATDGTTELRIARYASDNRTILNETTVDYIWMKENLPIYGDGRTHYYHEGPVLEEYWEGAHPGEEYDPWDPAEDVQGSVLQKGDLGAVMGTGVTDLCALIGGAEEGDRIAVTCRDGWRKTFPYEYIYRPDPRQGPLVICWFNGDEASGEKQGVGYPDTTYTSGMRMAFFADTSSNPWGWHIFGNNDMRECWDEEHWNYGAQYPSAVGVSGKWVSEIGIFTDQLPPVPVAEFETNVTSGRLPLVVAFNDTSTANPRTWTWNFGDGSSSAEKNPVHVYTTAGDYTVTLTVSNVAGTGSMVRAGAVTVENAVIPTADFAMNTTSGEAPLAVTFTDTSDGKPAEWEWDFGDGEVATGPAPAHVYSSPGTYTVALTAKNHMGSDTVTKTGAITVDVPVPAPPIASFSADVTAGDAPLEVAFTDTSQKFPTAWAWDFGDGASSDEPDPVHIYSSPGVYTVALTVTNDLGSDTATRPQFIAATENGKAILFRGMVPLGEGTFSVKAPSGQVYTPDKRTPMGALDAVAEMRGFTYVIGDKKYSESRLLFLDGVGDYLLEKSTGKTWVCFHNGELLDDYGRPSTDAFNRRPVADGDTVLFWYGDYFIYSTGKMEPRGGGVCLDNTLVIVEMTIGPESAAGEVTPAQAGATSTSAPAPESPPGVWLPILAIGLFLMLRTTCRQRRP